MGRRKEGRGGGRADLVNVLSARVTPHREGSHQTNNLWYQRARSQLGTREERKMEGELELTCWLFLSLSFLLGMREGSKLGGL